MKIERLILLARSNFDHYARECEFGIFEEKNKTKKQTKIKQKKHKKNLSAVVLMVLSTRLHAKSVNDFIKYDSKTKCR